MGEFSEASAPRGPASAESMTQQWPDQVVFEGLSCDLICRAGGELFDPCAHGLNPVRICTALDRGVLAHYRVDRRLWLDELALEHAPVGQGDKLPGAGQAPPINGVEPQPCGHRVGNCHYLGLALPIRFDGGLLIGDGGTIGRFPRGSPPPWAYVRLRELVFVDGDLLDAIDHSGIADALRDRDRLFHDADRAMSYPAAEEWRAAFCYDYGFSG